MGYCDFCSLQNTCAKKDQINPFETRCFSRIPAIMTSNTKVCTTKRVQSIVQIPENATNGDVIRAAFPELELSTTDGKVFVRNKGEEYLQMCFSWKWWNMPYKETEESCQIQINQ